MKKVTIKGMAHITGGGFIENTPRMFQPNANLTAVINKNSYPLPKIYEVLHSKGIEYDHMYNTFNMGVGMVLAVDPADADKTVEAVNAAGEEAFILGKAVAGKKGVTIC